MKWVGTASSSLCQNGTKDCTQRYKLPNLPDILETPMLRISLGEQTILLSLQIGGKLSKINHIRQRIPCLLHFTDILEGVAIEPMGKCTLSVWEILKLIAYQFSLIPVRSIKKQRKLKAINRLTKNLRFKKTKRQRLNRNKQERLKRKKEDGR